jgi:hypothetical protein
MNRCTECKTPLPAGAAGPLCARCDKRPEVAEPAPKRIAIHVDPELTLEHRISRLEELELLRLALHQAAEEHESAVEAQDPARAEAAVEQIKEAQKKISDIIQGINRTVRARLDERDRRRENAS